MKNKRAIARARKLQKGQLVAIRWLDSGRDSSSRSAKLAERWVYGRVDGIEDDTLRLAMDVCIGAEDDDSGNHWGYIWVPSILEVRKLCIQS